MVSTAPQTAGAAHDALSANSATVLHVVDPPSKSTSSRLCGLAASEALLISTGTLALLGASGAALAVPAIVGQLIQIASNPQAPESKANVRNHILMLLGLFVLQALFVFIRSFTFTLAGERVVRRLRTSTFASLISQEIGYFDDHSTGELLSRLSSDTKSMENASTKNVSMFVRSCVQAIGGLGILFFISWKLTLVMLAVVPAVAVGAVIFGKFTKQYSNRVQNKLAEASQVADEAISNIRTVRSFRQELRMRVSYSDSIEAGYVMAKKLAFLFASMLSFDITLAGVALLAVLWYGVILVLEGELTVGSLTSFVLYTLTIGAAFGTISTLYFDLMKAVGATQKVFEIIERNPRITYPEKGIDIGECKGHVRLDRVSFSYPARSDIKTLDGLSIDIPPGKRIALVGPSGAGKSTVAALIQRFYDPTSGVVTIDGFDLATFDPQFLQRTIAVVNQEPTLFNTTIAENITFGMNNNFGGTGEAQSEPIEEAAKSANAHDFIVNLPEGYATVVGERGIRLSGGQKQRIAIARALYRNPKILLLDEATSALDAESEHLVQRALEVLMENRTVLIIAHRLSTVRNAAEVVVLDKGVVVEQGTHDTLLAKKGLYASLVMHQLSMA